ncbi:xylulokinase [Isoptericola sp. b441]|uniref:Xylulose kinase n=1 Tax=Actinotalea lenta TaxID=3064654 RepID=A0ABT9D834_9CELL|nr:MULTISPECIES: xylulokinase [unclassified Isoptericola]MDO8106611.1 xylulokinase [Isoptericola sp. b441]MDO8121681.1 xylulokinase [Isoptericola sp. b490]
MTLVAGVDSSTQSCKVVIRDAATGELVRTGRATHPDGTEVAPRFWWDALATALAEAGGLDDVSAVGVGGQQHGMVALDADGSVVRDALLWNDTRSAQAAVDLIAELGDGDPAAGAKAWADAIGSVPVASFTVTKLRWLRDHEPELAARVAAVALPHDWLTWRLAGYGPAAEGGVPDLSALTTDRSDASGTGYWSAATGEYLPELVERALGHEVVLPRVVGAAEVAQRVARPGNAAGDLLLSPGAGDNAAAALGLGMVPGDVTVSIGTSGVVSAISPHATADASGLVTGFADATGAYLPLACTLNASRVLDAACRLLGVDHAALSALALSAPAGADGLVLVPYLEGERTPNKPDATGALHGIQLANTDPAHLARAFVEGMLCALADGLDALRDQGVPVERVRLIGGGARSEAVRAIAPAVLGLDVLVPEAGEYVADGAARQAAWALARESDPAAPAPGWVLAGEELRTAEPTPQVRARYAQVRDMVADRPA